MAIQQFTTTEREPVSSLFSSPAALVSAGGGVPWKPVLGIAAVLGGIAAIVYFVRRPETPEDQWLS